MKKKHKFQELENTITELKKSLKGFNRLDQSEESVNSKKDFKIIETEQKKKNEKTERSLRDTIKKKNTCIMEVPEGEEREKRTENLFEELMAEKSPNLRRNEHINSRTS